jgi:L-iditol 2-dehydrogenase
MARPQSIPRRFVWTRRRCSVHTHPHFPILDEVTSLVLDGYRNGFDLTQLISHRFQMEQAVEAIEIASHPQGSSMKIMIEPVLGGGAK